MGNIERSRIPTTVTLWFVPDSPTPWLTEPYGHDKLAVEYVIAPHYQPPGAVEALRRRRDAWPKGSHIWAVLDSALREVSGAATTEPGGQSE